MKILTKITDLFKDILRSLGIGFILAGLAYLCFYIYVVSVICGISIISDLSLSVGAGLATGLTIYALTNHRSKKERELIEIITMSQKAINDYRTLRDSLSKCHSRLHYSLHEVDKFQLSAMARESWYAVRSDMRELRFMNHNTLPELNKLTMIYNNDSFIPTIDVIRERITHTEDEEECLTYLKTFETETAELWHTFRRINVYAESELRILRRSLI